MPSAQPQARHKPAPSRASSQARSVPAQASRLTVLVAGVEDDQRPPVDAAVRRAFAERDPDEPWSVSVVRLHTIWSVTVTGPHEPFRNLSFTAEENRLAEAIGEAIGGGPAAAEPEPPSWPAGESIQKRVACGQCRKAILVTYEGQPSEPMQGAPLACPHCWSINHVEIGSWAAAGGDYRAEKG